MTPQRTPTRKKKPGPVPRPEYTPVELFDGLVDLWSELTQVLLTAGRYAENRIVGIDKIDGVLHSRSDEVRKSLDLIRADSPEAMGLVYDTVRYWVDKSRGRGVRKTLGLRLVHQAAQIVSIPALAPNAVKRVEVLRKSKLRPGSLEGIRRILERKGGTDLNKAFAVYRILSRDSDCEPRAGERRAPGRILKDMLHAALQRATGLRDALEAERRVDPSLDRQSCQ